MGWKGIAIGAWVGSRFGGSLGAILGAALGHQVEKTFGGAKTPSGEPHSAAPNELGGLSPKSRSMVFCASAAAMLAKLAKADGHVSQEEIRSVERAFERLNFHAETRKYAVDVFRRAKDDSHTIYEYAGEFAAAIDSVEVRELFYGLLWDLAFSDGDAGEMELSILRQITSPLKIRPDWFGYYYGTHAKGGKSDHAKSGGGNEALLAAYKILNVSPSASDEEIKNAYRDLAKKNHPDLLRAQGLPEELVDQATERMKRINEAWQLVRDSRK